MRHPTEDSPRDGTTVILEDAAEVKGGREAMRLIARAHALFGRGDIGSARIVLERASETGSAKESFMLARRAHLVDGAAVALEV